MTNTPQTEGLNVLEHGQMVWDYYQDIYNHLKYQQPLQYQWKLPQWIYEDILIQNQMDLKTIKNYQIYHDCGKPFCIEYDENGNRHFPNHAQLSYNTWLKYGGKKIEAILMARDMDIHLMKAKDIPQFIKNKQQALTLLLTGLAEIHANSSMFGGMDSISFKSKYKQIDRRGKAIIKQIQNNKG